METYFDIVRQLRIKAISYDTAVAKLAAMGTDLLLPHLRAAGITVQGWPADPRLLAHLLLASSVEPPDEERADGPRRAKELVGGKLYATDPPSLKRRFVYRKDGDIYVLALHTGERRPPRLEAEFAAAPDQLPGGALDDIPEWQPLEITDDPESTPRREPATSHLRVDVKLVFWIPYRPNTFPIPQRLLPPGWDGTTETPETDLALRAMLATGNPPPPDAFPTREEWRRFVLSKEYRGLLHYELYACCPGETPGRWYRNYISYGFTPAMSDEPLNPAATLRDRVVADRENKQSAGSIAENLTFGDAGTPITPIAVPGVPDRVEDAMRLLEIDAQRRNETHSPGEGKFEEMDHADCKHRTFKLAVRVGRSHNLLNFAAMGRLVAFQGSELDVKVCCSTATADWTIAHSAIPSARLYINNRSVWHHDMLTEPLADVLGGFYVPETWVIMGSETELQLALENPPDSPHEVNGARSERLARKPGCPTSVPNEWIYEP